MQIEHIAIWSKDIETLKEFYQRYFGAQAGSKYHNKKKNFYSYFLTFDQGSRLEIMQMKGIPENRNDIKSQYLGLIHFAIKVGDTTTVDELTTKIGDAGYEVIGAPRRTGDGYYESVILDPEGNRVEIMA